MLPLAGCHSARTDVDTGPGATVTPVAATTTIDKVWMLETAGAVVPDTSVAFATSAGRTIVLRHQRPDNAIFLILDFPPSADTALARDTIHVRVQPVSGKYAFTLVTADRLGANVEATFSYAIHFHAPADSRAKYPSAGALEQALAPARLEAANKVVFVGGVRPAADVMRFPVTAPGTFALVAAR